MTFVSEIRRRFVAIAMPVFAIGALVYLGYHFFEGERGLKASWAIDQRHAAAEAELKRLAGERKEIEDRVGLLREGSVDRDMLDEQLRRMLNLVHPGDVVILYAKPLAPDTPSAKR